MRSWIRAFGPWIVLILWVGLSAARTQGPPADSLRATGSIPFARVNESFGSTWGRAIELGIGLRTFNPDLSGLASAFEHTPSSVLTVVVSALIEADISKVGGIQLDAGPLLSTAGLSGCQGLLGVILYPPLLIRPAHRVFLNGGMSAASFSYEKSDLIAKAGHSGWYAGAGWERRLGRDREVQFYGAYSSAPRVSKNSSGGSAWVDVSSVMVGARIKWHPKLWSMP